MTEFTEQTNKNMSDETNSEQVETTEIVIDLPFLSFNEDNLLFNGQSIGEIIDYDANSHTATVKVDVTLKNQITELTLGYWRQQAQRHAAEFQNFKKRQDAQIKLIKERANTKLITQLADVFDNMNRAIEIGEGIDENGLSLVVESFEKALNNNGVTKTASEGEKFNPDFHEALSMVPSGEENKPGNIFKVVEQGFKCGDTLLKAAKVIVFS